MCEHVREHVCWARGGCGCVCLDEGRQQWEFTWHEEELSPHFIEIGCHNVFEFRPGTDSVCPRLASVSAPAKMNRLFLNLESRQFLAFDLLPSGIL